MRIPGGSYTSVESTSTIRGLMEKHIELAMRKGSNVTTIKAVGESGDPSNIVIVIARKTSPKLIIARTADDQNVMIQLEGSNATILVDG